MFDVTSTVKNSDKEKYVYSGYEIAFDGKGEWILAMTMLENFLVLIIVDHLILIISRIVF